MRSSVLDLGFDTGDGASTGLMMFDFPRELAPICRSITGNGVRQTLAKIGEHIPLEVTEIPTGTPVLDWTVPNEWNIRDAYVRDAAGRKVIDFKQCPLHVLGYSIPVHTRLSLSELAPHLFTDPAQPDWIPFRYSYYSENWGFCLSQRQFELLEEGEYEVFIDSSLEKGSLTYGECTVRGTTEEEVLVSVHTCHPWMCNDNLSGIAVATALAKRLASRPRRLTYRFVFIPTTIGSISWLSQNQSNLGHVKHGLVLTCVGDQGHFHYKRTRRDNCAIDLAVTYALDQAGEPYTELDFSPSGFDERQYSSPGFDLPVGCLMRTPNGMYPEYHTSADDLSFIHPEKLAASLAICEYALEVLDGNERYRNMSPWGEPQLTKRGIYSEIGGSVPETSFQSMLWALSFSDGSHTLLDIARRSSIPFDEIRKSADLLLAHGLLSPCE